MRKINLQFREKYDIYGHEKEYYEKLFPIGSEFIYKSKYGSVQTLISAGIHLSNHFTNGLKYARFYVATKLEDGYIINYEIDRCISKIRQEKLKRLINDNQ